MQHPSLPEGSPDDSSSESEQNRSSSFRESADENVKGTMRYIWDKIQARREAEAASGKLASSTMHRRLTNEQLETLSRIRIKLVGGQGTRKDRDEGIDAVRKLETDLVVDPKTMRDEAISYFSLYDSFKRQGRELSKKDLDPKQFSFMLGGGHVNRTTKKKLNMVWEKGYVLLAELVGDEGEEPVPVGYMYGLDNIPYSMKDEPKEQKFELHPEFPNLDARDLGVPDIVNNEERGEQAQIARARMLANWRTGVLPQYRKLGVGTALKFCILEAESEYKNRFTLNTGSVKLPGGVFTMPNWASQQYNDQFMDQWTFRQKCKEEMYDEKGEVAALMAWLAHHAYVQDAIKKLRDPDGVLIGKGWKLETIVNMAMEIREQKARLIAAETHEPDAAHALGKLEQ